MIVKNTSIGETCSPVIDSYATGPSREVRIQLSPRRIAFFLTCVVFGLTIISFVAQMAVSTLDAEQHHAIYSLANKVTLDAELNLPTWYASLSLLGCAALLFVIAQARRVRGESDWRPWLGLAGLFVLLSLDEMASFHEMASGTLRRSFHLGGALHFAWVIPAGAGLIVLALLYARFLWRLPSRTRWFFLAAAFLFVGGALGMELVGGSLVTRFGFHDVRYFWAATVEEFCEMMGVVVFIFALLDYLHREGIQLILSTSSTPRQQAFEESLPSWTG